MDVTEFDNEIKPMVELPGMEQEEVEINYADGVLTIRAKMKAET